MFSNKFTPLFLVTLILGFFACDKEDPTPEPTPTPTTGEVRLSAVASWDGESLVQNAVYSDSFNRPIRVETLEAYISEVYAINQNDEEILFLTIDRVNLFGEWSVVSNLPRGDYKGLRFGVGVPAELNADQDPAQYPNSHPLSVQGSQGMFWSWASGYIFIKFDGKVALDGDENNIIDPYVFHIGMESFYREFTMLKDFTVGPASAELNIVFNSDEFLSNTEDTIDLGSDNITHTMDNMMLANRFIDLFEASIELQ